MKRTGNLFPEVCAFENLLRAFKKAWQGSGAAREACRFRFFLEKELIKLKSELESGAYKPGRYRYFTIHDPKERIISVAPFRDRVVHHALVGVLEPIIDKRFIYDTYANRKGKGTHKAVLRARHFAGKNRLYLKTDVAKYFNSIKHEVLLGILARSIKDGRVIDLVARIATNSDRSRGSDQGRGLPIGNLTSQFFANLYLDPLDHFIKDRLGVRGYVRYMDDLVLFSNSRDFLKSRLADIGGFLENELGLRLKPSATALNTARHGLSFLGFRIFPGTIRIRPENYKRLKKNMQRRLSDHQAGRISEDELASSLRSMFEHLAFADTQGLRRAMPAHGAGVG